MILIRLEYSIRLENKMFSSLYDRFSAMMARKHSLALHSHRLSADNKLAFAYQKEKNEEPEY